MMITERLMLNKLNKIKEWIIDILFPRKCLGCGQEGTYICKDCEIFLSEVDMLEVGPPSKIVSVWEYEGIIEKAILKIKYDGIYDIAGELVEKAMKRAELNLPEDTIIAFVPNRGKKINAAELIAKKLGKMTNRPVQKLLEKIKDNRSQVGLGPQDRLENVRGAFRAKFEARSTEFETNSNDQNSNNQTDSFGFRISNFGFPANVLLVDDVYTTGATMRECIKTLKKAGAKNVWGFTLSRKMNIQNC